jgi:hypothetical protein
MFQPIAFDLTHIPLEYFSKIPNSSGEITYEHYLMEQSLKFNIYSYMNNLKNLTNARNRVGI